MEWLFVLSEPLVIFVMNSFVGLCVHVHNDLMCLDVRPAVVARWAGGRQAGRYQCTEASHAAASRCSLIQTPNGMQINQLEGHSV